MEDYEPAMSFDEQTAARYDDVPRGDEAAAVALLEQLAGGGPALELAIGTGRIALPLAARGVPVDGIDISPAMVERLRQKPGGDRISVTMGNFADVPVPGRYRLVFVVFNTLFNLLAQDAQVRCFENVAAHLTDHGSFVIEAFVPTYLTRLRDDQYVDANAVEVDRVTFDVGRHDLVNQRLGLERRLDRRPGTGVRQGQGVSRRAADPPGRTVRIEQPGAAGDVRLHVAGERPAQAEDRLAGHDRPSRRQRGRLRLAVLSPLDVPPGRRRPQRAPPAGMV
jgi:SAM-dependent methyltransferase